MLIEMELSAGCLFVWKDLNRHVTVTFDEPESDQ